MQANNAMGNTPKHIKKDWGLGGVLLMQDAPDGKKAGTMLWGGYPNLIWVCALTSPYSQLEHFFFEIATIGDIHEADYRCSGSIVKLDYVGSMQVKSFHPAMRRLRR